MQIRNPDASKYSVTANYEYGPFGEVIRATGPMAKANPFRFSTKYQDEESDLLYYGYRYYNASTGRWISRDPEEEGGSLNAFAFVENNSLNYDVEAIRKAAALPTSAAAAQQKQLGLRAKLMEGPLAGRCGKIKSAIWWEILNPTLNKSGGYVVQKITISWGITNCSGERVQAPDVDAVSSPVTYWEAWFVSKFATFTSPKADHFDWTEQGCTSGYVEWNGSASFYHGLASLPPSMVEWNDETLGGSLPSSTKDPGFTGGTSSVDHKLKISWDCCKSPGSATVVESHTP